MCFDIFQLYAKKVYHKKEYCTSGFPLIQYVLLCELILYIIHILSIINVFLILFLQIMQGY